MRRSRAGRDRGWRHQTVLIGVVSKGAGGVMRPLDALPVAFRPAATFANHHKNKNKTVADNPLPLPHRAKSNVVHPQNTRTHVRTQTSQLTTNPQQSESRQPPSTAQVVALVRKLSVGRPEDDCDITPVVSESSANFIEGLAADARDKGATFLTEYKREGNLIWPTLLDHVTPSMRIAWEEPFGPLLPIMRVDSPDAAVAHVNASRMGLQGCVFTRDINAAIRISDAMETGTVQVNAAPARGPDHFPFQGFRDSGIGSQGIKNSLEMMVKTKSTVINLDKDSYTMG